ncbi:angiotensin-converting enzyme-like isoform X2 [Panulirus ornatus]|uniref:angiotensin-converting enzyme-like isoform X2 n=1 Tax=Panulirus ornatus TaxID=150431 RepID=UPI003A88390D
MKCLCVVILLWCAQARALDRTAEESVKALLEEYHKIATVLNNNDTVKSWAYYSNMTEYNQIAMAFWSPMEDEDKENMTNLLSDMTSIYASGTVCLTPERCLEMNPGLEELMANSRDYQELQDVWEKWRTNVSRKIRPVYLQYIELMNKEAVSNYFSDYGEQLRVQYESATFEEDMVRIFREVEPLYRLLHAYVRKKLRRVYPQIDARGPLPACVLGDMWGRFWINIYTLLVPYPDQPDIDATETMLDQNYTVHQMFRMGDEFFTSMGLKPLLDTFWSRSILERPQDGRKVACHPSSWDFDDGKDFRIMMCARVNFADLAIIHHELGHIQYFMQYAHLPLTFRDGANPGFHEAIGELMTMSMSTPQHLATVGLLKEVPENPEMSINYLLRTSLHTVTTLPFHLISDLWLWKVLRGDYRLEEYNTRFWELKEQYLGVVAPVPRTAEDLDPPAIFHISSGYDMIRYFTRTILQFQFQEKLCEAAGHEGPLHTCDFYGSKEAGDLLAKAMSLGSSKPWQDVLQVMTGERRMSSRAILRYFRPLQEWLTEDNIRDQDGVGWGDSWTILEDQRTVDDVYISC